MKKKKARGFGVIKNKKLNGFVVVDYGEKDYYIGNFEEN